MLYIINTVGLIPGIAGVDNAQQLLDHIGDDSLVRVTVEINLVHVPA